MRTALDHQRIRHDGRLHLLALLPAQRRLYASVDLGQRLVADNQHNNLIASDCSDGGFPGVVHSPPERRRRKADRQIMLHGAVAVRSSSVSQRVDLSFDYSLGHRTRPWTRAHSMTKPVSSRSPRWFLAVRLGTAVRPLGRQCGFMI